MSIKGLSFAQKIAVMCTMRGFTYLALAKMARIEPAMLRGICQGKVMPTEETERAIRIALGLPRESDELLNSVYIYTYQSGEEK